MPPGMDNSRVSRSWRRGWLGVPLGAAFMGCVLVPTLPASADATLDLDLDNGAPLPGTAFSLPFSVHNTLDFVEVTIDEATATADTSDVVDLAVVDLPEVLSPGERVKAEVVGSVVGEPEAFRIRVEVEIAYSYLAPCDTPEPSPSLTLPASDATCPETPITGTAQVSAWLVVSEPTAEPTQPPTSAPSSSPSTTASPSQPLDASPSAPDEQPSPSPPSTTASPSQPLDASPSSPDEQPSSPASSQSSSSAPHSSIPHSPVSTVSPQSSASRTSSPPVLPTDAAALPELTPPADEYAELPMITPGDEDTPQDGAAPVSQEEQVDPVLTPFILLLVLMLLLLLATPLGPVRRVRVRHSYVGRRRKR